MFPASVEGGAKYLRRDVGRIDPMLLDFARTRVRAGTTVWDIGANVGLFTFAAAGLAGPSGFVLAVEADIWLCSNLRRATGWNSCGDSLVVLPAAVADRAGVARFHVARANRAANYLASAGGSSVTAGVREVQYVTTVTLDDLAQHFPLPSVLKIDVEGAEAAVLAGAGRVLEQRPDILVEVRPGNEDDIARRLEPHGYRFIDAETGQRSKHPTFNTLAIAS